MLSIDSRSCIKGEVERIDLLIIFHYYSLFEPRRGRNTHRYTYTDLHTHTLIHLHTHTHTYTHTHTRVISQTKSFLV